LSIAPALSRVKGVDLGAASGSEGRVLPYAMRMKAIDPEDGVRNAITDAIRSAVFRHLHGTAKAERR
jgi:hypothetical protein